MMSNIIEADAAKLAGLQIDLLQKIRSGNLTFRQLEWWLNSNTTTRSYLVGENFRLAPCYEAPSGEFLPTPEDLIDRFSILADLGIITVPDDYVHETQLATFYEQNRDKFYHYNREINDKNFPNPTRILKPNDKLRVRVFEQTSDKKTTAEEVLMFLGTQKATHTGAQGACLVFDQKSELLQTGKWYDSFDEKDRLWTDAVGHHIMPSIYRKPDDSFWFYTNVFEHTENNTNAFFCFTEVEGEETEKS